MSLYFSVRQLEALRICIMCESSTLGEGQPPCLREHNYLRLRMSDKGFQILLVFCFIITTVIPRQS